MARTIPTADTRSGALACPEERRAPARVLRSPLIGEDLEALAVEVEGLRAGLCAEERGVLEPLLFADVFSEYDARHLWAWLQGLELELSAPFLRCAEGWAADEELHFRGFRAIYEALTGESRDSLMQRLAARPVDFEPIAHLFDDELAIACLFAYDELATVAAYRANRELYSPLGPRARDFLRTVTADEGRHCRNFRRLIRDWFPHRASEVPGLVQRIRSTEGVHYAATFVLDHDDDDVWSSELFDAVAATLGG